MIPWLLIDRAAVPGGGELRLMRRGSEFSILLGSVELMNSRRGGSEAALARLACARLSDRAASRLLIGGLGMGFTLRAALAELGPAAAIDVAEISPTVVAWARGPLADIFAGSLDDPRVAIEITDVAARLHAAQAQFDAILLDVDNGPDGLSRAANDALYRPAGLAAARRALRPGGVLAVWSASRDDDFAHRLRRAGFVVEESTVRSGGARHIVWIASAGTNRPRG